MDTLKKLTKVSIKCQFLLIRAKSKLKKLKNCGVQSEIQFSLKIYRSSHPDVFLGTGFLKIY